MSGRYTQLPTEPLSVDDLETGRVVDPDTLEKETLLPGSLERADYDVPPPGSPPISQFHHDIGNTNGLAPGEPERPAGPRRSVFRRAFGRILPTRYMRVATEASVPVVGGGTMNDGVFANMAARPQKNVAVRTEDGNVHLVPEDAQDVLPPSYAVAQRDRAPEYGLTPTVADPNAEVLFDDLPAGSWILFVCSTLISFLFQIVGFVMTYILHTTHAQKYGSRLGLGMTLIQFGLVSLLNIPGELPPVEEITFYNNGTATFIDSFNSTTTTAADALEQLSVDYSSYASTHEGVSVIIMLLGTFVVGNAIYGFWRVKFIEGAMKYAAQPPPMPEEVQRNRASLVALFDALAGVHPQQLEDLESGRCSGEQTAIPADIAEHGLVRAVEEEEARLVRRLEESALF